MNILAWKDEHNIFVNCYIYIYLLWWIYLFIDINLKKKKETEIYRVLLVQVKDQGKIIILNKDEGLDIKFNTEYWEGKRYQQKSVT